MSAPHHGQGGAIGAVSQAGEPLQRLLGGGGEALQLPHHQLDHVVGEALGADSVDVPPPGALGRIEGEQVCLAQCREELAGEEGIARRLVVDQPTQGLGLAEPAAHRFGDHASKVVSGEWPHNDVLHQSPGLPHGFQHQPERVVRTDFVVAVGADHQEGPAHGRRHDARQELQGCRVEPLEIIEEEHQRMVAPSEHGEEAAQDGEKAILGLAERQIRHRRLRADEDLEFGNEVHDETTVRPQRIQHGLAPDRELRLALDEELAHQGL